MALARTIERALAVRSSARAHEASTRERILAAV